MKIDGHLFFVPGIAADSAFAPVGLPLSCKATAVTFVVVVVGRSAESVPPHSGSGRRFDEASMATHKRKN